MTTLRAGRVFFGGDSAHVHSPAGGQGMNTGIQDMINLGWKLAMVLRGAAKPELLDTYESDRLPVIEQVVAMTERATRVFNSTNPLAHALLTRLAPVALSKPAVQKKAAPRLGQIAATYRHAPIAKHGGKIGGLRAGDRVPDLRLPEGRLYDLIDMSTLTLFVTTDDERVAAACRDFPDVLAVHWIAPNTDLVPESGWLLVRPDGYLAAAGSERDADRLSGWLGRWMRRRQPAAPNGRRPAAEAKPSHV
jgi:hypothetical protein